MLLNLHVKNMALIDDIEVSFGEGLNILTGETGAGKSIIIGSIELALGAKLPKDVVGKFADYGLVELVFSVDYEDAAIKEAVTNMGIDISEGQIIISRKIINGKSIIKVNGETQTAVKLRELTSLLIDMHGQHEHESLLHKSKHLEILDEFAGAGLKNISSEYLANYKEYRELLKRQEDFDFPEEQRIREIAFLEYEVNEIEEADLKAGEDEELEKAYKLYSNQEKIYAALSGCMDILSAGSTGNVSDMISSAIGMVSPVSDLDCELKNIYNSLMDLDAICTDIGRSVSDYVDNISYNQEKANEVLKRLDLINKLKLKHGKTVELVIEKYNQLQAKLKELKDYECAKQELDAKISEKAELLKKLAEKITDVRKDAAKQLEARIVEVLMDLNFLEVKFEVKFSELDDFSQNGMDDAEFMISTNPGESIRPLRNIASGGELSRIMLGLKTILAGKDNIDTLIFDEIDTGISGKTAGLVAEKLGIISRNHQVICITHLPQIAAMADTHFVIEKNVVNDYTRTDINKLDKNGELSELARMLGGMTVSEKVMENAKEMKEFARSNKNRQNL